MMISPLNLRQLPISGLTGRDQADQAMPGTVLPDFGHHDAKKTRGRRARTARRQSY
jgi:hypothetical protein